MLIASLRVFHLENVLPFLIFMADNPCRIIIIMICFTFSTKEISQSPCMASSYNGSKPEPK